MSSSKYINISGIIDDTLARVDQIEDIAQVIPIAWPFWEVDHNVALRINEQLAVAERFVLDAIARFGPISIDKVGNMMGLDQGITTHLIEQINRFPDMIQVDGEMLSAPAERLDQLEEQEFSYETMQSYTFWVNAPTGKLLPRTCITDKPGVITMDYTAGIPSSPSGQKNIDTFYWIAPAQADGTRHLTDLITNADAATRKRYGVPEGAIRVQVNGFQKKRVRWEIAIGTISTKESMTIRLARRPEVILAEVAPNEIKQFSELLRRKERTFFYTGKPNPQTLQNAIPNSWNDAAECILSNESLKICLPSSVTSDEEFIADILFHDAQKVAKPQATLPVDLKLHLEQSYYWNPYYFFVRPIQPGNKKTAELILKIRGVKALQQEADSNNMEIAPQKWWEDIRNGITDKWPKDLKCKNITWQEIKQVALKSPDGNLIEFILETSESQ